MDVAFVFLIAGIIIMAGFFGNVFFDKTKISDVLLLLCIGIFLGPVLGLIEPHILAPFAEYFGTLALIIILFEGGMDMDIDKLIKEFGTASLLVLLSFTLSTVSLACFLHFVRGWDLLLSLLLGAILGCTSAPVVIPIINKMGIKEETKTLLSIESALSDVLAVICTISLIEIITLGYIGIKTPFRTIFSSFSIAIVLGIVAGLFWLKVLNHFSARKYSYMFTLAAVLTTFGAVSFLGGSGAMAILVFGIILGNSHDFSKFLKIKNTSLVNSTIKFFHGEMTFFIRTFFFVYIGMMVSFSWIDLDFVLCSLALLLIIVVVRYMSVGVTVALYPEKKNDRGLMMSMLPRGLASAVLATLPASADIRGSEYFTDLTFAIIIFTNLIMTVGVFVAGKKEPTKGGH